MENETDLIRNQMLETRTSLTEKLEALEEKVVSAVEGTTESVQEAVQAVTDSVQDTVSNVSESVQETVQSVKSTFDIPSHVRHYPWAMFGGAVVLGYLGERLIPSASTVRHAATAAAGTVGAAMGGSHSSSHSTSPGYASGANLAASHTGNSGGGSGPGWMEQLGESLAPVAHQLQGMAVGTLATLVGDMVVKSTPADFRPQLADWIEQLTRSLGGTPVQALTETWRRPGGASSSSSPTPKL